MIHMMKQMSGRIGSNIYASVQDQNNPHHHSFLRTLQKEMRDKDQLDLPLKKLKVVVFDLETTGFYPDRGDQILSIGAIKVHGEEVLEEKSYYSLVSAAHHIPPEISKLTGITLELISEAPNLGTAITQFFEFSRDYLLVAHHSKHEQSFLNAATKSLAKSAFQQRIVDTSLVVKAIEPQLHLKALEDCCSYYGINTEGRHHALQDAKMTAYLWSTYIRKFREQGYINLRDVYEHIAR